VAVRTKTIILVAGTLIVGLIAIHLVSHAVLIPSYASLESRFMRADLQRALSAVEARLISLDAICHNWATSNEVFHSAAPGSAPSARPIIVESALETLGVNIIAAYDTEHRLVLLRAVDLSSGVETEVPTAFLDHLRPDGPLFNEALSGQDVCGILCLTNGSMLVSARPILKDGDDSAAEGVLVLAALIDEHLVEEIRNVTFLPVAIAAVGQSPLDTPMTVHTSFAAQTDVVLTPLDGESIRAQALLMDVYGEPVLQVSFVGDRNIYAEGQHAITFLLIVVAAGGLLLALVVLWGVDRTILRRLSKLASEVRSIGEQSDFRGEVSIRGDDEISFLAGTINETLAALAQSHQQLSSSHLELEETASELRRTQHEFTTAANRLRRLTRHLQSLREDERAMVATEIHDQVSQGLTALRMDLAMLQKETGAAGYPGSDTITRMIDLVNMLQDTVRRLSAGLRPSIVEDLGLPEALEWRLREFARGRGLATELRVHGSPGNIEAGRALGLFRILQDALHIVTEDPSVTRVAVTLTVESRYALLAIEDNGRTEFSGDAASRREMGLSLIQERVDMFGGGVTIAHATGTGTTIVAQVPF